MVLPTARPFPEAEDEIQYDYRHPLYIGDWRKSIAYIDEGFAIDDLDEPHMKRRITILNHHPEIEQLYGYDIKTIPITIIVVLLQIIATYVFGRILLDWDWVMIIYSYFIGGTMTQIYFAIIHEAAHCLAAPTRTQNRMVGLLANIAIPLPIAMSFRRYHLEHHVFQGVKGIDPDLPLEWEKKLIRVLSIGNIFHPAAAHFIQEHYTFDDGQETYSYYGILNKFLMNIGYHNEHHDFTRIPWTKLPEVRQIASEYYDHLAYHTSWLMVHWNFVTQRQFGPQSRVKRSIQDHRKGRKMLGVLKKSLIEE
ncbi:sphingolipid delta(4)-desaturase DES1-like [Rhizophagus clarus]|uniref:Sphingolipid delta(4)-desaturase DES1-like n=1 Tax=Rhizophagus clarus TaxID=94130 RepID=A0A8H3KXY5_9GLOM|nr:sphingolipid delta(4)-desaturase DES1-like [Rhizophagus clarus]